MCFEKFQFHRPIQTKKSSYKKTIFKDKTPKIKDFNKENIYLTTAYRSINKAMLHKHSIKKEQKKQAAQSRMHHDELRKEHSINSKVTIP